MATLATVEGEQELIVAGTVIESVHAMQSSAVVFTINTPNGPETVSADVSQTQAERVLRYARTLAQAAGRRPHLSPREKQVLAHLGDGRSYKEIASDLELSIDTIRTYVRSLYRKLGAHSVTEALRLARSFALI